MHLSGKTCLPQGLNKAKYGTKLNLSPKTTCLERPHILRPIRRSLKTSPLYCILQSERYGFTSFTSLWTPPPPPIYTGYRKEHVVNWKFNIMYMLHEANNMLMWHIHTSRCICTGPGIGKTEFEDRWLQWFVWADQLIVFVACFNISTLHVHEHVASKSTTVTT